MANPTPPTPGDALGTIRGQIVQKDVGDIEAPNNIIQTVTAARTLYENFRFQALRRNEVFAGIEGLIQGNPPYDPAELEANGLNIANFNNMDGTARYEKSALSFWNLLSASENIAKFEFYDPNNPDMQEYAEILGRNFNLVVREWESFVRHFCCVTGQLLRFGYSALIWPDERDWRWEPVETAKLYVPDECSTDTSLLTTFMVETPFTVQELYKIYETFKDKDPKTSPWNVDVLATYLVYRANSWATTVPGYGNFASIMDLQTRLQNNDTCLGWLYSDQVRLVTLFQKEYSGEISHYIFDRYYTTPHTGSDGFLYFVNEQYSEMREAIALFTFSPDVFTIHSNRGVGHKLFAPCQATMQLDCDVVNMARLSSSPIIQTSALSTRDIGQITFRPGVPLDIGTAEFQNNALGSNIPGVISAGSYLLGKLSANIAYSGDDPEGPDFTQGSVSDSQAKRKDYKEQGVLKNNIAHFYSQFDPVIMQMVVKMLNSKEGYPGHEAVTRWKDLCVSQGVPEILFTLTKDGKPRYFYARASRAGGDGSTLGLITGLESIAPLAGGFSATGMRNYQKDVIRAHMGNDYISSYLGDKKPDETSGGASVAAIENNQMKQGQQVLFSPDNEQRAHIKVHFQLLGEIQQAVMQQQMHVIEADKIFGAAIPHTGQHVQFISQNPLQRSFFQQIREPWEQFVKYAELLRRNASQAEQAELKKRQDDEQATQKVMREEERKDFVAQSDQKRKDIESGEKMERNKQQSETRAEIQKDSVLKGAENQRRKIELEAGNKRTQTQNELESRPTQDLEESIINRVGETPSPSDFS